MSSVSGRPQNPALPRRPLQVPPPEQVDVQVKNRLPSAEADVQHGPVAILYAAPACDIGGSQLAVADQLGILSYGFLQSANDRRSG